MLNRLLCILLFLQGYALYSQSIWTDLSEQNIPATASQRETAPRSYRMVLLDLAQLRTLLSAAPMRFTAAAADQEVVLPLPLPDGGWGRFRLTESPVMAPALQAQYPEIRCYTGVGVDDPGASLKCDLTPHGFHAMIRSGRHEPVFIDPYRQNGPEHCIVYKKSDLAVPKKGFVCAVDGIVELPSGPAKNEAPEIQGDCMFRQYRLALACTAEYAAFHGGTIPLALAAMNTTINRVNGIYERDLSVSLQLFANNNVLVFLDPATDGYTNGNVSSMIGQNQTKCNTVVGAANYDIGHVFGVGGGGVASLGVVCGNSVKARGVTALSQPVGDPFDVDYVAHEMGHQFGANHCFNNSCSGNINPGTAFEPGSGSTIMAYAGVCSPNVQPNSDAYFHAISLQEIGAYTTAGQGNVCPLKVNTGNNAPAVDAGANYTIPKSTPFALTATGNDANGDSLTYCWEQMDHAQALMPPLSTNTDGPMFRSFDPTASPTRYFPRLADLAANTDPTWEELPGVARAMTFRVTVRDNRNTGGCTAEDNMNLAVSGTAGPFIVTAPNTAVTWLVGSSQTVSWDVANTTAAPVSCAQVRILLSTDGGLTYPTVLAGNVPNTGAAQVDVPNAVSATCRVMVQAVGNVFFDISNQNFKIEIPPAPTFLLDLSVSPNQQVCSGEPLSFSASTSSIGGFNDPVTIDVSGAPPGAGIAINPNPLTPGNSAGIELNGLDQPGIYTLTITAASGAIVRTRIVDLAVLDSAPEIPLLLSPADGASGVIPNAALSWSAVPNALQYQVQVATNPSFAAGTIVFDQPSASPATGLSGLDTATVYYWRVNGENACAQSGFSAVFAFQTARPECSFAFNSTDVPVVIPTANVATVISEISVPANRFVADVNLSMQVNHTWVGDLVATLVAPDNTSALLLDQPGVPATSSGCNGDNLSLQLDDEAAQTAADLENTCGNLPALNGAYQPAESLDRFNLANAQGVWTLSITDNFPEDGGALNAWSLSFCFFDTIPPTELLLNQPLTVASGASADITTANLMLNIASANADDGMFTLLSLPQHGTLQLDNANLEPGGVFTQADILAGRVSYTHNGTPAIADTFLFDVADLSTNGWLHGQTFSIIILQNDLEVSAQLLQALQCHDGNNAQIAVTVTGGTPPYSYRLNGGTPQAGNIFDGLAAGVYSVAVTDQNGFMAGSDTLNIDNPAAILVAASVLADDITAQATGGTAPLAYSLDGLVFQNEPLFENVANGLYTLTVRDANGCTGTATATVAVDQLIVQINIIAAIACHGGSNGAVTASVSGGVGPYTYSLDGAVFQPGNTFSGLSAGTFAVTVRDDSGNTATSNAAALTDPPVIEASAAVNLNAIIVTATGGTGALEYSLDGQQFQFDITFGNLANGPYTVTVRDANGCTATVGAVVDVPPLEILELRIAGAILCYGETVSIEVAAGGGIPPYTYSLGGGTYQPGSLFGPIGAGTYAFYVLDAAGTVVQSQELTLSQPDPLNVSIVQTANDILVQVSGGVPPYEYTLDGGLPQDNSAFTDLPNGAHTLTVADGNDCVQAVPFVMHYIPMSVQATGSNPLCAGEASGQLIYTVSGGTPPYSCTLNSGPCALDSLTAGSYTLLITDAAGDTIPYSFTLLDPPALTASATVSSDTIYVTAAGGAGALEYSLDGIVYQTSPVFAGVANATYAVRVRDANGCIAIVENIVVNFVGTAAPAEAWGLAVQPNPSAGRFHFILHKAPAGPLRTDVFDTAGRLIQQQIYPQLNSVFSTTIDLASLPPGVYWLRLTSGMQTACVRLLVQ
jgi:subtilisin-like proprotein convertase family protein